MKLLKEYPVYNFLVSEGHIEAAAVLGKMHMLAVFGEVNSDVEHKYDFGLTLYGLGAYRMLHKNPIPFSGMTDELREETLHQSLELFEECAQEGHAFAIVMAVAQRLWGMGCEESIAEAEEWLKKLENGSDTGVEPLLIESLRQQLEMSKNNTPPPSDAAPGSAPSPS